MFFGYGLNGFASGILFVPIYPMLVTLMDPDSSNNNIITDKCSAVIGMTYSLAQILSPILGGYFTDIVGFQSASDIFMAFSFTVSVLYAFVLCSQGERI
jgi:MFS family permease